MTIETRDVGWPFTARPPESLLTSPFFEPLTAAVKAALDAVNPEDAVTRALQVSGSILAIDDTEIALNHINRIRVIGGGKATEPMARAVHRLLGDRIDGGAIVVKNNEATASAIGRIRVLEGAHPVPDHTSIASAETLRTCTAGLSPDDLVIVLVSGGASALLTLPAAPVRLSDLQVVTNLLLGAGVDITAFNTVRKHLSEIKGGALLRYIHPARAITLILSDVVGDPIEAIGSGPTAPDDTTFDDAVCVLKEAAVWKQAPPRVRQRLLEGVRGRIPDTPSSEDPIFERCLNRLVGANRMAMEAAAHALTIRGIDTRLSSTPLTGEAREAGSRLARLDRKSDHPTAWIFGGETTVTLTGNGKGGRNQELALAAALNLTVPPRTLVLTLATDGGDGPTDAAGAVATHHTCQRARALGLDPTRHLLENNAYPLFARLDDLLLTGPTQTNVADITMVVSW